MDSPALLTRMSRRPWRLDHVVDRGAHGRGVADVEAGLRAPRPPAASTSATVSAAAAAFAR